MKHKRKVLSVGDKVLDGKYEILKVINTSGMSNVYLVMDRNLKKQWCLKEIVKSESGRNMIEYRSLLREADIMKSLNHSNIPRIVTIEEENDTIFIVMDYVDGISAKDWILRKGKIEQKVVVNWSKQICSILIYLHNRKNPIFYRDMKPDNIMIQNDGSVKLLDFGISEVITDDNKVIKESLGTRGFAAPEQSKKGLKYDLRSDIYALGMTMYYMLTGINPAVVKDGGLTKLRDVDQLISTEIERIVNKCIEKDVNRRYQSVEELLYDLQNYEKYDEKYVKRNIRKVKVSVGMVLIGLMLCIGSVFPFISERRSFEEEYKTLLNTAMQSGMSEDYVNCISLDPLRLTPYIGFIDAIKSDGMFTSSEEESLLGFLNPNLQEMEEKEGFGEIAFNVGKLYWFYYEGKKKDDGIALSVKWFEKAIESGYNEKESGVFYNIGLFKRDIGMRVAESDDSGEYLKYWNLLKDSLNYNVGELVELQLDLTMVDAIMTYSYRMKMDGVTYEDVIEELERIEKFISTYNPSIGKAEDMYKELSESVPGVKSMINNVWEEGK